MTERAGGNLTGISDWHCLPNYNINPHVFRQVSSTPNPTGAPVIFVHGMDGDMTNRDTIVLNLTAEFKAKHNVYEYQYNCKDSILISGRQLKHDVDSAGFSLPQSYFASVDKLGFDLFRTLFPLDETRQGSTDTAVY